MNIIGKSKSLKGYTDPDAEVVEDTTEVTFDDSIIVLNQSQEHKADGGVLIKNSGDEAHKGLIWDESESQWVLGVDIPENTSPLTYTEAPLLTGFHTAICPGSNTGLLVRTEGNRAILDVAHLGSNSAACNIGEDGANSNLSLQCATKAFVNFKTGGGTTSASMTYTHSTDTLAVDILGTEITKVNANGINVTGDVQSSGQVKLANGSAAAPSVTFTNDTDTGIYSGGVDTLAIAAGGVSRMEVSDIETKLTTPTFRSNNVFNWSGEVDADTNHSIRFYYTKTGLEWAGVYIEVEIVQSDPSGNGVKVITFRGWRHIYSASVAFYTIDGYYNQGNVYCYVTASDGTEGTLRVDFQPADVSDSMNTVSVKIMSTSNFSIDSRSPVIIDLESKADTSLSSISGIRPFYVGGDVLPNNTDLFDLGSSSLLWDDVYATNGSIITTSDQALKASVRSLDFNPVEFVKGVEPKQWVWAAKKSTDENGEITESKGVRSHIGPIAQDIESYLDENKIDKNTFAPWVSNTGIQRLRPTELQWICWSALRDHITTYEAKIAELEARLDALETQ